MGHWDSFMMYNSLHNQYIASVYLKCCDCKVFTFPQRTFGLDTVKQFLVTFCGL